MSLTKVSYSMIDGPQLNAVDFGVVGDGAADDTAALQAFFNAATSAGGMAYLPPPSVAYKVSAPLTITIGSSGFNIYSVSSAACPIRAAVGFSGGTAVLRILGTAVPTSWSLSGIDIRPLTGTSAGTATVGIQIGDASAATIGILGYQFSKISDVMVANFQKCWSIAHARMIYFDRCGGWNNGYPTANSTMYITQNGAFTGDFVFDTCQFVNSNSTGNKNIEISSPVGPYDINTGNNSISGLTFRSCDIYAGEKAVSIYAGAQSWITDIWFVDGCQIDQEVEYGIYAESNNASSFIGDVHIDGLYVNKSNQSSIAFTSTGTGGAVKDIWIESCIFIRPQNTAISFFGSAVQSVNVHDNIITDCATTSGAITFNDTQSINCTNNRARTDIFGGSPYYLIDLSLGADKIYVSGNQAEGTALVSPIRDDSGDVTKTIVNNPGYNPLGQTTLTVTASPFTYKNTSGAPIYVCAQGGVITAVTLATSFGVVAQTDTCWIVPSGKTIQFTYSSLPAIYTIGV